jgi:hypothetical protein
MKELIQIDSMTAHACATPRVERCYVLEPVTARWSWLTLFNCCNQVYEEYALAPGHAARPQDAEDDGDLIIRRAA